MARAQYFQAGYTPPAGVGSATAVKDYQRKLGVRVDGIWGPDTQAAYEKYTASQSAQAAPTGGRWDPPGSGAGGGNRTDLFNRYYQAILGQLNVPSVSLNIPSADTLRSQWQEALRPSVDAAISRRRTASQANRAELDADAVSRGMGGSSYVSSLKERENADAQGDIGQMEAQYGATLAERIAASLQSYDQMRLAAQQYNQQAQQAAQQAALGMAGDWYANYTAQQNALALAQAQAGAKAAPGGSRGASGGSSGGARVSSNLTTGDYLSYVERLPEGDREQLFTSGQSYWKVRRDELQAALGGSAYEALRRRYLGA